MGDGRSSSHACWKQPCFNCSLSSFLSIFELSVFELRRVVIDSIKGRRRPAIVEEKLADVLNGLRSALGRAVARTCQLQAVAFQ